MFVQLMKVLAAVLLLTAIAAGGVSLVADTPKPDKSPAAPGTDDVKTTYHVKQYHILKIRLRESLPDIPLDGYYLVRPDGTVDFGLDYGGKVSVAGLTLEKAQAVMEKHLSRILKNSKVSIETAGRASGWPDAPRDEKAPRFKPGQVLTLWTPRILPDAPIEGPYRIGADGDINLGAPYGSVAVKDLTVDEATEKIWKHLRLTLKQPQVAVFPGQWIREGPKHKVMAGPPPPDPRVKPPLVKPGQVFTIWVKEPSGTKLTTVIDGRVCVVSQDGEIDLGAKYGKIMLKGRTADEVVDAILKKLRLTLKSPRVEVLFGRLEKEESKRKKD